MNVFKKALVAIALLAATFSAQAIEVSFDFTVFSSGSSIYPCNAGIKHANPRQEVCYERTNPNNSCNPNACEDGESCDCVCAGTNGGQYNVDFLKASYANWTDHNETIGSSTAATVKASTSNNYIFSNDSDANGSVTNANYFDKQLTALTFNLGTETFGAEYVLDVCFRGPQIDYASSDIRSNWTAKAQATIQDMLGYESYASVAGLKVDSEVVCEHQVAGNPLPLNTVPNALTFGDNGIYDDLILNADLGLSDVAKGSASVTGPRGTTPTFCRVRYTFSEGNGLSGRELFRPWKKQAAKVCTKTSIEEP
ncbi:hypothetical protein [Halobacteriovorax sp. HLS]|uniref:hypothetical protein n=1 Tax=Halobacteriovorax sp. HLS TaxID=2234000 RepID=UPI000FDB96C5|nr:hypothetical protein [Halobacteriovorax sp. HLS]